MKLKAASFMVTLPLILFATITAFCEDTEYIDAVIVKVVYETENGYVTTNNESYRLPDVSSMIDMDNEALNLLISSLLALQGKKVQLFIKGNVIVGVESINMGLTLTPPFNIREKVIYSDPPSEITTNILSWYADSYGLSVTTSSGTFCVHDEYVYSDYYKKVYDKLSSVCGMDEKASIVAKVKYHPIENSYECAGEIEDIEVLK